MNGSFYIVDAFTPVAFRGNPAAVVVLDAFPTEQELQEIAAQVNLSETAFLVQRAQSEYELRWFTPTVEVNLCGHATLAATHVLKQLGQINIGEVVTYHTLSGELTARALDKGIELDLPLLAGEACKPPATLNALGVDILACQKNRDNYLVEVEDYDTLLECKPSFKKLAKLDLQGVIVTTATGQPKEFDFASRYFGSPCGIDEDPATGSAHCFLAPYWAEKLGKKYFHCLQASKGRGIMDVVIEGDRVKISGQAVTTLKGHLGHPQPAIEEDDYL